MAVSRRFCPPYAARNDAGRLRREPLVLVEFLRHQLLAVAARLLARGLGGEAAQEREQRLDLADIGFLAAGEHALDHAPLEARGTARLGERSGLAHRLDGGAE